MNNDTACMLKLVPLNLRSILHWLHVSFTPNHSYQFHWQSGQFWMTDCSKSHNAFFLVYIQNTLLTKSTMIMWIDYSHYKKLKQFWTSMWFYSIHPLPCRAFQNRLKHYCNYLNVFLSLKNMFIATSSLNFFTRLWIIFEHEQILLTSMACYICKNP